LISLSFWKGFFKNDMMGDSQMGILWLSLQGTGEETKILVGGRRSIFVLWVQSFDLVRCSSAQLAD
jgi:hypothetical protein